MEEVIDSGVKKTDKGKGEVVETNEKLKINLEATWEQARIIAETYLGLKPGNGGKGGQN